MKWIILAVLLLLSGCSTKERGAYMETLEQAITVETAVSTVPDVTFAQVPLFSPLVHPADTDFVRVTDYIPDIQIDLKYATADNFTGQVIYDFEDIFLRYGTVMKLKAAAEELSRQGISFKLWDGFRPVSAQFKLWEVLPDSTYVANPNVGFSNHSRGFAVDLTLVTGDGTELEMPTAFDDFSARADRDYSDCTEMQAQNARLLESVMEKHGFQGYWGEWWHFNDTTRYEVEYCVDPGAVTRQYTALDVPLRRSAEEDSPAMLTVPAGEGVTVLGYDRDHVLVEYWGYRGYVAPEDLKQK